jgi:phosphoesterase RecJ-like protein
MMTALESGLRRATEAVARARRLAISCHINPDGDALGSALGFAAAARNAGLDSAVSFGSPFVVGDSYRFLPLSLLVPPAEFPADPDVMVTFDVASVDRLGELESAAARAGELIVVDHHASNPGFGTINLIEPSAAASAQLAYRLILELGWPIDEVVATCLLTGLVTDTGRFQYGNTSPETLRAAADMVEAGARPEVIGRHVYEESPFGYLGVQAAVLSRAVLEQDRSMVWSVLHASDLERHGIGIEDTDPLIDAIRVAQEAEVAVLLKEVDGSVKASLRSRGLIDVGSVAVALGGGGHHNASGLTHTGPPEATIAEIRKQLPKADG